MEQNNIPADVQEKSLEYLATLYQEGYVVERYKTGSVPLEWDRIRSAYIAGATAEADKTEAAIEQALHKERNALQAKFIGMETKYLKQIGKLKDVLDKIVNAPVPANEREYISWFVTAKNIAGGAISEYEADNEMQQWKDRKEVVG